MYRAIFALSPFPPKRLWLSKAMNKNRPTSPTLRVLTIWLGLLLLCAGPQGMAQKSELPDFHPPMDIPLFLSGNFAELRRNHFHTGIDIKTGGTEGHVIRAAESGKVVRIGVSPWGYGKVLYIEHENGYTTVYAHMSSFSEKIDEVCMAEQYRQESYKVDFHPDPPIPVSRAEEIGRSGNSGSSGGPHLHFEIRKSTNQRPQNPLHFGFDITDNIPPRIRGVRFHPKSDTSLVNGTAQARSFVVLGEAGSYRLKAGQSIAVYGAVGLSLHALDFLDGYPNKCGIYELTLEVDGELICEQRFDELDFSTSRQINCYKDYQAFHQRGWHYHKSFREPGNELEIYAQISPQDGLIFFPEKGIHEVRYTCRDAYGNTSVLEFQFESLDTPNGKLPVQGTYDAYFDRERVNTFEYEDELALELPAKALYEDLKFQFGREMPTAASLSPYYQIHEGSVPLDKAMRLSISAKDVPERLQKHLIAARFAGTGGPSYISGELKDGFYSIRSKDFGRYCLMADSIAPSLTANKYSGGGQVGRKQVLGFAIKDAHSGLAKIDAWLNGQWVLTEYEPKKQLLMLDVAKADFQAGKNELEIRLIDHANNETRKRFSYTY